jgi:hypothetical protein
MLKFIVASAVLILGVTASAAAPLAGSRSEGCVNCSPVRQHYASEDVSKATRDVDQPSVIGTSTRTPAEETTEYPNRSAGQSGGDCVNCPPPRKYDSIEVVKNTRDVDQSRVIDTDEVVQVRPKVKEVNKLVIHENETRNVGVVQHNHRIIEKETRYVKRAPAYHRPAPVHRVVQRVQTVYVPVMAQPVQNCGCPCTCSGSHAAYAQAYVYETAYAYGSRRAAAQQVLVPVTAAYGYR